jgi:hypothetical protein
MDSAALGADGIAIEKNNLLKNISRDGTNNTPFLLLGL